MRTQTCDGWPNGLASRRKFNAIRKKAISVQPCTRVRTKENNTEANLRWPAKRLKTCVRLRENLSSIKMDTSHRETSQVHAIHGQAESQVTPSLQLAITCNSVWPKNYRMHWAIFKQLLTWLSIYIFVARRLVSRSTFKNFVEVVE